MRNHDAQLARESFSMGRDEGISIGEQRGYAQAEKKYQVAEKEYIAQLEALRAENARLKAGLN